MDILMVYWSASWKEALRPRRHAAQSHSPEESRAFERSLRRPPLRAARTSGRRPIKRVKQVTPASEAPTR